MATQAHPTSHAWGGITLWQSCAFTERCIGEMHGSSSSSSSATSSPWMIPPAARGVELHSPVCSSTPRCRGSWQTGTHGRSPGTAGPRRALCNSCAPAAGTSGLRLGAWPGCLSTACAGLPVGLVQGQPVDFVPPDAICHSVHLALLNYFFFLLRECFRKRLCTVFPQDLYTISISSR